MHNLGQTVIHVTDCDLQCIMALKQEQDLQKGFSLIIIIIIISNELLNGCRAASWVSISGLEAEEIWRSGADVAAWR